MAYLQIGELAKESGVETGTLRYYERLGLIPEPQRSESGYRQYPENMIDRISFIKRMQEHGFTLHEIKKLLAITDGQDADAQDVYEFTVQKLSEVQKKMAELEKIETMLLDLQRRCPGQGDLKSCPIIESLVDDQSST